MADDELRKVMLSGGGPGNGSMWTAHTKSALDLLPDAHFILSTVLRLGCESNRLRALLKFSHIVRNRLTAGSTTHSHAKLDWHACADKERSANA